MDKNRSKAIRCQSDFCHELMARLDFDIQRSLDRDANEYWLSAYTQKQDDIRRLRRELLALHKLLDQWAKED